MWPNSKTQNMTKLKNARCDKTIKLKICKKNSNMTKLNNFKSNKRQKLKI